MRWLYIFVLCGFYCLCAQSVSADSQPNANTISVLAPVVVEGPGDARISLAKAMQRALVQQGVKIVSRSGTAYSIRAKVSLDPEGNGVERVTIRWVMITPPPPGKQMEKMVIQKNNVIAGRLNGAWDFIADQAAGAAALEVAKILQADQQMHRP